MRKTQLKIFCLKIFKINSNLNSHKTLHLDLKEFSPYLREYKIKNVLITILRGVTKHLKIFIQALDSRLSKHVF